MMINISSIKIQCLTHVGTSSIIPYYKSISIYSTDWTTQYNPYYINMCPTGCPSLNTRICYPPMYSKVWITPYKTPSNQPYPLTLWVPRQQSWRSKWNLSPAWMALSSTRMSGRCNCHPITWWTLASKSNNVNRSSRSTWSKRCNHWRNVCTWSSTTWMATRSHISPISIICPTWRGWSSTKIK